MTFSDDALARTAAVDPAQNVVLEASAGTGKTRVLVERYVNLLLAGVEPDHILAITFTRKAAAEMRQRIVERLKEASRTSVLDARRWRDLRERLGDIAISTIDAFCLSLLREFPLEAGVDPGFDLADDTQVARLVEESLDGALRICRARSREDDDVALVFALLGERRLRAGLGALLDRRLVAPRLLARYLASGPDDVTAGRACRDAWRRLHDVFRDESCGAGGLTGFLEAGPVRHSAFAMLAGDLEATFGPRAIAPAFDERAQQAAFRVLIDRLRSYFLTQQGEPRKAAFAGTGFTAGDCSSPVAWKRHRDQAASLAPAIAEAIRAFRRDLNVVLARGVWRIFGISIATYQRALDEHGLLDFSGVLERAVDLLKQMEEFAQSRYRLEARYQHVLVDEFQDTSRAQWDLVAQLVHSWGEGLGASADAIPPSIFIVGDRKQSIYGFRDADVAVLDEAAAFIGELRPDSEPRRAISVSFRAVPPLLAFVNDVFGEIDRAEGAATRARRDRFRYDERDRFPERAEDAADVRQRGLPLAEPSLGFIGGDSVRAAADRVADEIVRLLAVETVRDRQTGIRRPARPADIGVLFRSRDSHREFEAALERRGVSTYVYKGLGFFEADEIQDVVALLRFLADPSSHLRAAAFLRSRFVRMSDEGIRRLAADLSAVLVGEQPRPITLPGQDRAVLDSTRARVARWLTWVDRVPPSELLDAVLRDAAYDGEIRGVRHHQACENLKKFRGIVRRVQNRGYTTLARIADHLDRLAVGDESNATVDAVDAVSLMTVHAAKGLEFPIVFVVNIGRGAGGIRAPIRVFEGSDEACVAIADYQSEADQDAPARDREELKRLLYVALTRARDRLYLSATIDEGVCRPGRGSLAEVLPKSLVALFGTAGGGDLAWTPSRGQSHIFLTRP